MYDGKILIYKRPDSKNYQCRLSIRGHNRYIINSCKTKNLAEKLAYPQMDNYQLTLMFYHILASSPQAFASMLKAPIERTLGDERVILESMREMAAKITKTAKMEDL